MAKPPWYRRPSAAANLFCRDFHQKSKYNNSLHHNFVRGAKARAAGNLGLSHCVDF
jgi:hypothetical protein